LFMVTSRFDVDKDMVQSHGKYELTVHYRLAGKYDLAEGYSDDTSSTGSVEDVRFMVTEVNGDWRISDIQPNYPHASQAAALQWVNQKLAKAQDPVAKTIYQHAVDLLQSQKVSPFAK